MSNNPLPIDISKIPELRDLVEEVETTKRPRALKRDDKVVAVLSPVLEDETGAATYKADYQTSLAAIGSWSDLNTEELITKISQWRNEGSRPPIRP